MQTNQLWSELNEPNLVYFELEQMDQLWSKRFIFGCLYHHMCRLWTWTNEQTHIESPIGTELTKWTQFVLNWTNSNRNGSGK